MAGHSKWSTIKRKKGALDAKRGKIFTRCAHEISVAVKEGGGGDPDANPRLRLAIDKARSVNMPNDNIQRAIRRATGEEKGDEQFELTYEGYGPAGTAVLVEVLTDNKNRTVSEVRHAFSRCGGTLGESGCVNWMFTKKGLIAIKKELIEEEALLDMALENGAQDVKDEGSVWEVLSEPAEFHSLREELTKIVELEVAEVVNVASSQVELSGKDAETAMKLLDALDDLDDVLSVSSNADFVDE